MITDITNVIWNETLQALRENGLSELSDALARDWMLSRDQRLQAPILGAMKAGKSSLLNALLGLEGDASLPQDVLQVNARPVYLSYEPILYQAISDQNAMALEPVNDRDRWVGLVRGDLPLPADARLEMGVPSPWLEDLPLSLIDTPGINTPSEGYFEITWATVPDSHLAIFACQATQVGTESDRQFIEAVKRYAGGFIFVITQIDLVGARHWRDNEATRQVESLERVLAGLDIKPLAICPVSTRIADPEASGLENLKAVVATLVAEKREQILFRVLANRAARTLGEAADNLASQRALLGETSQRGVEEFRLRRAELEARMMECQGEKHAEERKLRRRLEILQYETLDRISDLSSHVHERIQGQIDAIDDIDRLEKYLQTSLRAELDSWRAESLDILRDTLAQARGFSAESAEDRAQALSEELSRTFDKPLSFAPPPVVEVPNSDRYEAIVKELEAQREQLQAEMTELQSAVGDDDRMYQLQASLETRVQELQAIVYVPQKKEVVLDRGRSVFEQFGQLLGKAGDIVLTLAPIPAGKLKFLKDLPGGVKMLQGIKRYNVIIGKKNALLKNFAGSSPVVSTFLDQLSVETWGRRAGSFLGNALTPDNVVSIEDPEVKKAYLEQIEPYERQIEHLKQEILRAELESGTASRRLDDVTSTDESLRREIIRLKGSQEQSEQERARQLEAMRLLKWKTSLAGSLQSLLTERQGAGWHAELRRTFGHQYEAIAREAVSAFYAAADRNEHELRAALAEAQSAYGLDQEQRARRQTDLDRQREVVQAYAEKLAPR